MQCYLEDKLDFTSIERILVIKLQHLGDVLLTSPVYSTLKEKFPHLKIDVLLYKGTEMMLSNHPSINQQYIIDRTWKTKGVGKLMTSELALYGELKENKYNLIINYTDRWRAAWLARLLKPQFSVSQRYSHRRGKFWCKSFSHLYSAPKTQRHAIEIHLDALRRLGIYPSSHEKKLSFYPGESALIKINMLLSELGLTRKNFIVIHPTSRWMFKAWNPTGFSQVIKQLNLAGHKVIIISGPEKSEINYVQQILSIEPVKAANLAGQLTIQELAVLIDQASCFIGLDSVAMHLAAAMGTPCVALFGPTKDLVWGPWMVKHHVLTENYSCRPCDMKGCGEGMLSECLQDIKPITVINAAYDLLENPK
jgi:heptosyltransferase III